MKNIQSKFRKIPFKKTAGVILLTSISTASYADEVGDGAVKISSTINKSDFRLEMIGLARPQAGAREIASPFSAVPSGADGVTDQPAPLDQQGPKKSEGEPDPPGKSSFSDWDQRLAAHGKIPPKRGWSKTLARAEIAYQILNVVDMAQTLDCMGRKYCTESNIFLGKRPSKLAVIGFTAATGFLHYKLIRAVSKTDRDVAKVVAFTMLAGQGLVVGLNFKELY